MNNNDEKIPVFVITGFLGSGKTTLLKSLLQSDFFEDTAVLINEFGEVGLDHYLVGNVPTDNIILDNGCICCTIRDDLVEAIHRLNVKRQHGEIPRFKKLIIESTGLANPGPIIATFLKDLSLKHHFRVSKVITTVDSINSKQQTKYQEWTRQVTAADHLVLTKTDLLDHDAKDYLPNLSSYNPLSTIIKVKDVIDSPDIILSENTLVDSIDNLVKEGAFGTNRASLSTQSQSAALTRDFSSSRSLLSDDLDSHYDSHYAHKHITSFCLRRSNKIMWSAFGIWLSILLNRYGDDILRVKAILNIIGSDTPVIIHGVQHLIYPPEHLDEWPGEDTDSKIVFIVSKLNKQEIESSFNHFLDRLSVTTSEH